MFDLSGWLMGPEFLGALAAFISGLLTLFATTTLGGVFGTTV